MLNRKLENNFRIMTIQSEMSERALELLALPEDESCYILDLGCGSGICIYMYNSAHFSRGHSTAVKWVSQVCSCILSHQKL